MTIIEMLGQSGILTLLGMGVVFTFLVIMVVMISQMGRIIAKKEMKTAPASDSSTASQADTDNSITAAITAAITEYRKSK